MADENANNPKPQFLRAYYSVFRGKKLDPYEKEVWMELCCWRSPFYAGHETILEKIYQGRSRLKLSIKGLQTKGWLIIRKMTWGTVHHNLYTPLTGDASADEKRNKADQEFWEKHKHSAHKSYPRNGQSYPSNEKRKSRNTTFPRSYYDSSPGRITTPTYIKSNNITLNQSSADETDVSTREEAEMKFMSPDQVSDPETKETLRTLEEIRKSIMKDIPF